MKTLDQSQAVWPRDRNNVFPFLISLQHLDWYPRKLPDKRMVFIYLPHINNVLAYIWYVNHFGLDFSYQANP